MLVAGKKGDDRLVATSEDDKIWGGMSGTDTAVFSGLSTDYQIIDNGDGSYTFTDLRDGSPDGRNIRRLRI